MCIFYLDGLKDVIEKAYLTIEEVAKRFGVDRTTVYRLTQKGTLPGFKVGGQWRFGEETLKAWVAERIAQKRLKDEFTGGISHELRTPLSIIQEGTNLILEKIPGGINKKQEEILQMVKGNIGRLARAVNNLLDLSGPQQLKQKQL